MIMCAHYWQYATIYIYGVKKCLARIINQLQAVWNIGRINYPLYIVYRLDVALIKKCKLYYAISL